MSRRVLDDLEDGQAENYVALFDDRIPRLRESLSFAKNLLQEAEARLDRSVEQLRRAESLVTQDGQPGGAGDVERHTDDFNRLCEHPDIGSIDVDTNRILIETGTIKIEHQGTTYTIGRFVIMIQIDEFVQGGECMDFDPDLWPVDPALEDDEPLADLMSGTSMHTISMANIDNVRYGIHDHPHVQEGRPCWGNIGPTVTTLLQERRYPAVIALCIEFLKSYTYDGDQRPYLPIEEWGNVESELHTDARDWPPLPAGDVYGDDDDDVPF